MQWKDEFERKFKCKVHMWGLNMQRVMVLIDREDVPSLSEIDLFFTQTLPDVSSVRVVTDGDKYVHFVRPSTDQAWRISKVGTNT